MRSLRFLSLVILAAAPAARAQDVDRLPAGAQLRVVAKAPRAAALRLARGGTLERVGPDSLVLRDRDGERLAVARAEVRSVYMLDPRPSHGAGARHGALIGALLGAGAGLLAGSMYGSAGGLDDGTEFFGAIGLASGALLGSGVGASVGSAHPRQRWRRVEPARTP